MSNFVLLGYGRMGKRIQEIAEERGHRIVLATDHTPVSIPACGADPHQSFDQADVVLFHTLAVEFAPDRVVCLPRPRDDHGTARLAVQPVTQGPETGAAA